MQYRGPLLLWLAVTSVDLVACTPSFLSRAASRVPWASSLSKPSSNGKSLSQATIILRGGSDEGVTIHGTTSSIPEKLYLPGLLDTTILRTNKVRRVVNYAALCATFPCCR